ncbi:GNAT family N-acetyltransferase [Wenjunlia tyrosinilytica]|uniref:GNAT family N-acetyltransferase n=1 Tax=Wenjunlia tyrosinilytica TaxID=1544741 RepID=UPI003570A9C9
MTEVDQSRRDLIEERLVDFNSRRSPVLRALHGLPADEEEPLQVYALDDTGEVAGGLTGYTWGHWLHIDLLWVSGAERGTGLGSRLLERAEAAAVERGCVHSRVESWGFQAPGFYEKRGYRVLAAIEDYPPGETDHLLVKALGRVYG